MTKSTASSFRKVKKIIISSLNQSKRFFSERIKQSRTETYLCKYPSKGKQKKYKTKSHQNDVSMQITF